MVTSIEVAWQNKSIPRSSDFRGVLIMGLLAAWFYFVWQFLSLPPFAALVAGLPPLLGSALAKGKYMPDFGMIVAGFAAFHFRRELRKDWDTRIALQVYLSAVVPLIAYLAVGVALLEAVHLAGPTHALVLPWRDRLMAVQFLVLATVIVFAFLWPFLLHWLWTADLDIGVAGVVLVLIFYGANFTIGWHEDVFMWPLTALLDFLMGVCLCTTMFRSVAYLAPVRGAMIILGWMSILMGSILAGPSMVFLGFLMVLSGSALGERSWFLPGEWVLLIWSRTALAIVVVQPALFSAWLLWGVPITGTGWKAILALAVAVQLLATVLCLVIETPARRLTPAMPA
jgi:hypothetical protein